jgi:adenine phosphoribosyltransferase
VIERKIDAVIREVPNFPKKGIDFKDITSLLLDSDLSSEIVDSFINKLEGIDIDAIVGVESRGFLFGFLLANKIGVPFIPIRKSGKLPGDTLSCKYELEYGSAEVEIHKHDIKKDWNVLVHDDLLATGGTAGAAAELINQLAANIAGFAFVVSLDFLNVKQILRKYSNNIISLKNY